MNLLNLLVFRASRKVGFGLWLFICACFFLVGKLISAEQWFLAVTLSSTLIGGGTVADKFLANKGDEKPTA